VQEQGTMDVEKYLRICEQLGQVPDPAKMPLESSAFPEEVQVAFFMFDLLSDRWDGMSGTYLGKDWSTCLQLFEVYEVEDTKNTIFFMKLYEAVLMKHRMEEQERKRKAAERKQQQAGKTYAHNVRG
tara:strand:- start:477 stop:857 length:381 start_codon:yes stop_codon:yes gene_type:complete